ncbi:MAG: DUF3391 domain-containing protein [Granulosicoccus sp.]
MLFNSKKSNTRQTVRSNERPDVAVSTRLVADKRWVHRNQLDIGMYVNELDKPWEETRFMFQGFLIDNYATLRAVQEACEYANVQTEKVAFISSNSVNRLVGASRLSS